MLNVVLSKDMSVCLEEGREWGGGVESSFNFLSFRQAAKSKFMLLGSTPIILNLHL